MLGLNNLYQGDCLEVMNHIDDKSIDMILCDLPYGTTACKWDAIIPFEPLWDHYKRIIKDNGAIVLTASQPFTSALVMSNPKMFKHEWIWCKNRGSNFATLKTNPFKEHESIVVFCKKRINYYPIKEERSKSGKARASYAFTENSCKGGESIGEASGKHATYLDKHLRNPSSIQKFNCEVGLHPTQKPVKLFEYLIKTYTNEGDLVLDNCAGSGTTGVACKNLNRDFIMIEQDEKYCQVIHDRLNKEV